VKFALSLARSDVDGDVTRIRLTASRVHGGGALLWAAARTRAVGLNRQAPRKVLTRGGLYEFGALVRVVRKHTVDRSDDAVVAACSWAVAADVQVLAGHRRHNRWALVRVGWTVVWHARDVSCRGNRLWRCRGARGSHALGARVSVVVDVVDHANIAKLVTSALRLRARRAKRHT
jgi:hypothetical protein